MLKSKIGWLDILANDTHEYYYPNNTGGPSIKVSRFRSKCKTKTEKKPNDNTIAQTNTHSHPNLYIGV